MVGWTLLEGDSACFNVFSFIDLKTCMPRSPTQSWSEGRVVRPCFGMCFAGWQSSNERIWTWAVHGSWSLRASKLRVQCISLRLGKAGCIILASGYSITMHYIWMVQGGLTRKYGKDCWRCTKSFHGLSVLVIVSIYPLSLMERRKVRSWWKGWRTT